jgi:hypothetical protein
MATKTRFRRLLTSDPIIDWRLEQLVEAGYDADDALMLVLRRDVDLHQATRLLRDGCPVEIALQILT